MKEASVRVFLPVILVFFFGVVNGFQPRAGMDQTSPFGLIGGGGPPLWVGRVCPTEVRHQGMVWRRNF